MTKDEAESAIRHACHEWREERGFGQTPPSQLSFSHFYSWFQQRYSASYLKFRTTTSVRYDVEMWFEQELGVPG